MLALLIAVCLLVAGAACYWTRRDDGRRGWLATLAVTLVPLLAFVLLARERRAESSPFTLQVVGQYAFVLDTVAIGSGAGADVRVAAPSRGGAGAVRVHFEPGDSTFVARAERGAPPTFLGVSPVNATPLGARATISFSGDTITVRSRMPLWPAGCLLRLRAACAARVLTVRGGSQSGRSVRVRVPEDGVWSDALVSGLGSHPAFLLFRRGGSVFVAEGDGPRDTLLVNDAPLPTEARERADTLELGTGRERSRVRLVADRRGNRLHVLFTRRLLGEQWPLDAPAAARRVHRVSYASSVSPGTLSLLDLSGTPLGPRARSYAGVLEWERRGWRWHADGRARPLGPGRLELFPGTSVARGERGHLVRIVSQRDERGSLAVIAAVWLIGALLLAHGASSEAGAVSFLRTGVLGAAYTLAFVRATLAVRVTHAEPHNTEAVPTTLILLIAFPALVWLLERWPGWLAEIESARGATAAAGGGWRRRALATPPVMFGTLVAAVWVAAYYTAGGMDRALFAALIVTAGTVGLLLLQLLLVPSEARASVARAPLGMLEIGAERGFGRRHLLKAVSTLFVLVSLYIALAVSLRGVPPFMSVAVYAAAVAAVYGGAYTRERLRPRLPAKRLRGIGGGAAALVAIIAVVALAEWRPGTTLLMLAGAALGAGVLTAAVTWLALGPRVRRLGAWPYRRSDILPPLWFAITPILVLVFAQWGSVRRLGITLGFALALAGLLLVVRVFTVLWHRETKERVEAHLRGLTPTDVTRRRTPAFLLLALSVYAGYLGADRGLMLLLLTAVLATIVIGAAMLGARRFAVALATLAFVVTAIFSWLDVSPVVLAERPTDLATPQIRYAAVRHPQALERQMLVAPAGMAREIVSTLQQDWGMRAFAAAGQTWGTGLYGTPFSRRAISEDVALTDNAFAVFVLSEHGFAGGAAVLSVYVALALLLLGAAVMAGRSVSEVPRGILLGGLAMYVAIPALYMAAANVSLLPLTGQNLPLLGLRSGADVAFGAWLLALAVAALPRAKGDALGVTERAELNRRAMRRLAQILAWTGAVVVALTIVVLRALYGATHRPAEPFQLAVFAEGLRAAVERADILVDGDSIATGPIARGKLGFHDGDFVRAAIARANAVERRRADFRSHCAERTPWLSIVNGAIGVSEAPCRVEGMLASGPAWRGSLTGRGTRAAGRGSAVAGGGENGAETFNLVFAGVGGGYVIGGGAAVTARATCRDSAIAAVGEIDIACERGARIKVRPAEMEGLAVLEIASNPGSVTVNGEGAEEETVPLRRGDIIAVDSASTWVADEAPRGAFAYGRRRNGRYVRDVMPGTSPLLARLDSLLAEGLRLTPETVGSHVELTLDPALMTALQRGVDRRCGGADGEGARVAQECAVMLVDAEHGDILALASWEPPGAGAGRFAPLDANFRNHRAASTIKPIIAAAVLNEYPSLRSLVVEHPGEEFTSAAGWSLGSRDPMRSELNGCPRVPVAWDCFIPTSNNLYAVTLGFLGAGARGKGLPALDGDADGPGFSINGRRASSRVRFDVVNGKRSVAHSPLARQLEQLFDARIGLTRGLYDASLWRGLTERQLLRTTPQWQRVSPDVPQLPLDMPQFADLRYLAGFMIGENENNWSNAALVRGVVRLMAGRGVELRLVHSVGDSVLPPTDKQGVQFGPARRDVLSAMRGVVRDYGTAARTTDTMFTAPGFELFGKTGTLASEGFEPVSLFLFGGRNGSAGSRVCPVAGIVYVETERAAGARLTGVSLFADVVAPALRERAGWGKVPCAF